MEMLGLYELLPLVIQNRDQQASGGNGQSILSRILEAIQVERDITVDLIDGLRDLLKPELTSTLVLSLLASQLGITFPFTELDNAAIRVSELAISHKIKGTVLGLVREMKLRGVAPETYVWELWKSEENSVGEYSPNRTEEFPLRAARVIFVADADESGPPSYEYLEPYTGDEYGVFTAQQIRFSYAKLFDQSLRSNLPIHVIVPVPTRRVLASEPIPNPVDDTLDGSKVYLTFEDACYLEGDELEIIQNCINNCQMSCQNRCETLCEDRCESNCETTCQALCEATCQATCQTICEEACEQSCEDPCQSFCQVSCQSSCEEPCQLGCQQACQSGCQTAGESCQSYCELNCQTAAEVVCQQACESVCQSAAQLPCDCGSSCETACEGLSCETLCEAYCQGACEVGCESACEQACEAACEAGTCQNNCELAGCEQGCESPCEAACQGNCQNTCEATCEAACQTSCEGGSCQTGAESCVTTCQGGACESGCQSSSETGCANNACESSCQSACESGTCQTACELSSEGCQTTCETGCESACEGACQLSSESVRCDATVTAFILEGSANAGTLVDKNSLGDRVTIQDTDYKGNGQKFVTTGPSSWNYWTLLGQFHPYVPSGIKFYLYCFVTGAERSIKVRFASGTTPTVDLEVSAKVTSTPGWLTISGALSSIANKSLIKIGVQDPDAASGETLSLETAYAQICLSDVGPILRPAKHLPRNPDNTDGRWASPDASVVNSGLKFGDAGDNSVTTSGGLVGSQQSWEMGSLQNEPGLISTCYICVLAQWPQGAKGATRGTGVLQVKVHWDDGTFTGQPMINVKNQKAWYSMLIEGVKNKSAYTKPTVTFTDTDGSGIYIDEFFLQLVP